MPPRAMQIVTKLDLPSFDYTDPALVGDRFHAALRELRRDGWLAAGPFGSILLDRESFEFFLRHRGAEFPVEPLTEMFDLGEGPLREVMERNLLTVGGADHRRLRALVNPALSARGVERYRPAMGSLLAERLASVEAAGRCEFVSAVAKPYTSRVIATVIGAPLDDAERLHELVLRHGDLHTGAHDVFSFDHLFKSL
jgi:cytochrome P450